MHIRTSIPRCIWGDTWVPPVPRTVCHVGPMKACCGIYQISSFKILSMFVTMMGMKGLTPEEDGTPAGAQGTIINLC